MKKMILRAGFLLLATVLCTFSSYAYWIYWDENSDPSSGIPVNVEVISLDYVDIEFLNLNTDEFISMVDDGAPGGCFSLNLVPGDYWMRLVNRYGETESHFTIFPHTQRIMIDNGGIHVY
jgi:hypothetical protein